MPSRELIYRVSVQTSDAKRQAQNMRSVFEAELRQINVGKLDTSGLKAAQAQAKLFAAEMERAVKAGDLGQLDTSGIQRAVSEAQALRTAFEQARNAAANIRPPSVGGGGIPSGLAGGLLGGFAGGIAINELRELGQQLSETARRGAVFQQLGDVLDDYTRSVGTNASAMIDAAKKAAQGTISEYELILNANRAIQFEVAKTPEAFAKLIELSTALGRAQGIADTQALEFLTTGLARESRLILDNLGLIIDLESATKRYADTIGKSADQLTTAERKQALLEEAFRQGATAIEANRDAADSAATQFERLDANSQNLRDLLGELIAQGSAAYIASLADALEHASNVLDGRAELPGWLDGMGQAALDAANDMEASTIQTAVLRQAMAVLGASVVGFNETVRAGAAKELTDAFDQMEGVVTNAGVAIDMTGQKAKAVSAEILTLYGDQESSINKALMGRAEKSVDTIGADQALAQYRQAKQDAEAALQSLMDAGVTDATELQFRSAEILTSLLVPFDELEARANQIDFSAMSGAISSLNAGFVDFLPGVSSAREELASLSQEMMFSSTVTAEQLAQFKYLSAVAYSVADGGSQLSAVINDLGNDFLASNAYAAELVNQLVLTEAAYRNGAITGDIYAGVTATLTGQLLTLAQGAGIATGAIYALNSAQADMASPAGLAIGGSIANRIQSQQQTSGREQNRREMERYNKDLARSQERSAGRAGKLLEDGAKKANQELRSALDKVPGLFSASQVTEQDMKDTELGVYQEKADEYLRRLRDEVQNGNDWEDVSLEEARAGLERAGLEVGSTAEQTVALLEKAINDSSLYSAVENIPIFINEEAVKFTQELQSKSEEGRKNIYEYFGLVTDEAVSAATGGGGGGGGGGVAVRPPELIDIDPLTEGLQTGLDEYVNASGEMVKEQMAKAKALFFDPANLFGTKKGATGAMGPAAKPEIIITADASAQALTPFLSSFTGGQGPTTAPMPMIAPTVDGAALQAELDKLQITLAPTLADDAGQKIAMALGDQLGQQSAVLISHGAVIGKAFLAGIQQTLSVDGEGNATIDFAGFIANNLGAQAQTFIAQGKGIASLLQQGLSEGMAPAEGEAATGGVAMQISSITLAEGVRAPDVSVMAKIDKFAIDQTALLDADLSIAPTIDLQAVSEEREKAKRALTFLIEPGLTLTEADRAGFISNVEAIRPVVSVQLALPEQQTNADGSQGVNAITPLLQSINTQTRAGTDGIMREGASIAMILVAGLIAHFKGGQQSGGEQAATPIADALMTSVSAQFMATQGMFYAVGFGPASSVESGFKGYAYDGLSSGLLDALTNGIRADADAYMQRGATIAGYVQKGIGDGFSSDIGIRSAVTAGGVWGNAFMQGALNAINAAGFVDQITTAVVDGITDQVEQP